MQNLPESPSPVLFQMGGGEATHNLPQHWSLTLKPHGIVGLHSGRREPAMEPPPSAVPDAAAHLHHRGAQGSASGLPVHWKSSEEWAMQGKPGAPSEGVEPGDLIAVPLLPLSLSAPGPVMCLALRVAMAPAAGVGLCACLC